MNAFLKQGKNIVLVLENKSHTVNDQHLFYNEIVQALKEENWEEIAKLVEVKQAIATFSTNRVTISDDQVFWDGQPIVNSLTTRLLDMMREGFSIAPFVAFLENLMQNPSKRAVDELYEFLERGNLPLTPDGHFLAFKKVKDNYRDCHTGQIDNSVGQVVTMERNAVDDDKDRTCSAGLHFCSEEYLRSFSGSRIMILKINPANVVAIPSDYQHTKGRCCTYEVIGELENTTASSIAAAFKKSVQEEAYIESWVEDDLDNDEDGDDGDGDWS